MKYYFKKMVAGLLTALCTISFSICAYAENFSDVATNHFAYSAINAIASKGIMSGDETGKFNPDKYIDKFDTSKMFAKLLGYKYSGISDEETIFYNKAYENQKALISKYSSKFKRWNSSADKEIAFLLEKQFYTEDDLEQFVILNSSGTEQLRALSREEMAEFLVRYIGKTNEAKNYKITSAFSDDNAISASKKQSVYYLKSLGIINGTTDGKFIPKGAVTRADFCYLLNLTMIKTGKDITNTNSLSSTGALVNNVGAINCTVEKYFASLNILQVNENGVHKLYKVTSSASIKINGYLGQISNLPIGSQATITLNNGEIIAIDATNSTMDQTTETTTQQTTNVETKSDVSTSSDNTIEINEDISPDEDTLTPINGTITDVGANTVTISYKMIDALNNITTQNKIYTISSDCKVKKNNIETTISSIEKDDMADAKVYGSKIYSLNLTSLKNEEQKDEIDTIDGYISAINMGKNVCMIGVSDEMDSDYTIYTVEKNAVPVYDLSLGDKVRIHVKNGKVTALTVKKSYDDNSLTGYVTSKKSDFIVVEYYDGETLRSQKVYTDDDTVLLSGITGKTIKFSSFDEDVKVYVVLNSDGKTAKNITLIENI